MSAILVNSRLTAKEEDYLRKNNLKIDVASHIGLIQEIL
jgi:hypothetical protein